MGKKSDKDQKNAAREISRRDFLKVSGVVAVGAGVSLGCGSEAIILPDCRVALPAARGYLLVDTKKCQGCVSCMLACSLVHEGTVSLSLSRIQIVQSSFEKWPDDLDIAQCRQCVEPECVTACPTGALAVDPGYDNVRRVFPGRCIGCRLCENACPHTPARAVVAPDDAYEGEKKSRKCDLCLDTPYHWDEAGGGPGGKQACIEVCPVRAITFTEEIPVQEGDSGYKVNLRDANWALLGFPTED